METEIGTTLCGDAVMVYMPRPVHSRPPYVLIPKPCFASPIYEQPMTQNYNRNIDICKRRRTYLRIFFEILPQTKFSKFGQKLDIFVRPFFLQVSLRTEQHMFQNMFCIVKISNTSFFQIWKFLF